jgi:NUP50 (Nucleoporin 50 kDa)
LYSYNISIMVKRGSDNQLTKDDYESETPRNSRGPTQGFERATAGSLSQRRIVSARRPKKPAVEEPASSGFNPFANVSFAAAPAASNAFANVSFASTAQPNSTASSNAAPAAFSFGSGTSTTPATTFTPATGGFSYAATASTAGATPAPPSFGSSAPATGGFSFGQGASPAPPSSGDSKLLVKRAQNQAFKYEDSLFEECRVYEPKKNVMLGKIEHYLDLVSALEDEYWKRMPKESAGAAASSTPFVSAAPSEDSKPATNPFASAPASGLFGSSTSSAAAVQTNSTFSFSASAPPAFGAPVPAAFAAADTAQEEENEDATPSLALGNADADWNDLQVVEGTVHVSVGNSNKAKGPLKLQQNKITKAKRFIMRDPSVGKVLVNMTLPDFMSFQTQAHKKYSAGIEIVVCKGILNPGEGPPDLIRFRRPMQKPPIPSLEQLFTEAGVEKMG